MSNKPDNQQMIPNHEAAFNFLLITQAFQFKYKVHF